jgi:hypothetical protein
MTDNKRSHCGAIGAAPALTQIPPLSSRGREAWAQGLAVRERSTRMRTNGRLAIHGMCFASSSNRRRCIGKARSALSAILGSQKHPIRSTGVFRVGRQSKPFRSTSRKPGTAAFRPPSRIQQTYTISIGHSRESRSRIDLKAPEIDQARQHQRIIEPLPNTGG